ncbi:hypothetical protein TSUD_81440, partial [Trifolium subterraneum]
REKSAEEMRRKEKVEKVREVKPPKSQFTYHTPLNAPRDRILSEISSADFKSAGIRFPKQLPAKPNVDKKKLCRFHKSYGHVTDDCVHLKDAIEILIQKGYARQYIDGQQRTANNAPRQNQLAVDPASPEQPVEEENRVISGVALAISRPEDFLPLPNNGEKEALDYLVAHLDGSWENFPGALVISGGGFNPVTIGSIKRKFDELEKASLVGEIKITEVKESSVPLALYREELTEETLVPYVGSDLQGFNGSTTKPWGYEDLIVTFGENKAMKSVKVKFLVVDCPSLYNCIIGRPTLAELFAVSSTIHLKLKYYTKDGQVATINGDIEAARRCFEAASKNLNSVVTPKKKKEETKLPGVNSISTEDAVKLDARTSKKERKQEKKAIKDDLLIKENFRPIPDGEFKLVPLGEDPTKDVKIGADLPDLVKRQLKACLRENAELFSWSAAKMPGIDPEVACHQLTIYPSVSAVVQRRRKQSPEKAEAARKARGIEANPDKCRAFFDYPTPKSKKSIQTLNDDMLTSMARFVAKSAQHALPLFKLLRKETTFEWTEECEGALQHLKRALSEPPVLTRPVEGEKLYLYLAVASEAISAVLIRETEQGQKHVYFSSDATTWSEAIQSSEAQSRSERLKLFRNSEEFRSSRMFRGLQEGQPFKDQSDSKLSKVHQKQRNSQSSEGYINYNLSSLMICYKVKLLYKGRRGFTQRIFKVYSCPSYNGNFSNVSMSFSTHINMPKKELMNSAHQ